MKKLLFAILALGAFVDPQPTSLAAQSSELVAFAQPMLGSWNLSLQTPDGVVPVRLTVREADGAVQVLLGNDTGDADPITRVSRSGESLVAEYEMDYQGMMIDAEIRMHPAGADLDTEWAFAEGMYTTSAKATRD